MDNARTQGELPNSGYMLRSTQEHACLRISAKAVDMPEDRPQTPQSTRYFVHLFILLKSQ